MTQPRTMPPQTQAALLIGALLLAALGQAFIIRQDQPWTLWTGLALYVSALSLLFCAVRPNDKALQLPLSPSPGTEAYFLVLIFLTALFFRRYKLETFPAGIFPDDACGAYGALRILHEGWRPFHEIFTFHAAAPSYYYELALWFKAFPATALGFFSFSVFLSLLTLGFLYAAFRKLAGTPAALLSVFILAVMRWDVTFSRNGHLNIDVPFYLSAALCFWLYASPGRIWLYALAAVFFAGGFYGYTSYYAFLPLMSIYALYERSQAGPKAKRLVPGHLVFFGLFTACSLPLIWHFIASPDHGNLLGAPQD